MSREQHDFAVESGINLKSRNTPDEKYFKGLAKLKFLPKDRSEEEFV